MFLLYTKAYNTLLQILTLIYRTSQKIWDMFGFRIFYSSVSFLAVLHFCICHPKSFKPTSFKKTANLHHIIYLYIWKCKLSFLLYFFSIPVFLIYEHPWHWQAPLQGHLNYEYLLRTQKIGICTHFLHIYSSSTCWPPKIANPLQNISAIQTLRDLTPRPLQFSLRS